MMQRLKDQIDHFEELFKTKAQEKKRAGGDAPKGTMPRKQSPKEQVLETSRIRNVGEQESTQLRVRIFTLHDQFYIDTSQETLNTSVSAAYTEEGSCKLPKRLYSKLPG